MESEDLGSFCYFFGLVELDELHGVQVLQNEAEGFGNSTPGFTLSVRNEKNVKSCPQKSESNHEIAKDSLPYRI